MALERELETYRNRQAEIAVHEGKFVLIHGDDVVDFFGSYEDAIRAGYRQFALAPFLVRQVQAMQQVQFITRLIDPCCTQEAELQGA